MSDDRVHIRDLMIVSKADLKNTGTVPNVTICGENDPNMDKLTFGDYKYVLSDSCRNACPRCRAKWRDEESSNSNYKKSYNDFRKILFKALRGGR